MTSQNSRRFGALCVMAFTLLTAAARADEIWVAPTSQQDVGGSGVASNVFWPVTPIGAVRLAWAIPNNLQTFQSAKLVLIPHAPGGASTLNVFICPAEHADAVIGGCAGPFAQPFVSVANQLTEVDVSAIVAPRVGTAGATYLAVLAYTVPTTTTDHVVGLRFAYTPTAPSGVATLGANTFSGTQAAPAFVGNGAGLTNLPVPSGVATLGANVFGGTQTAPAFVGDGAGVSNVNATLLDGLDSTAFAAAGSTATLGANTFTGTQTINAGNLDLDPSTATTGNITKNGAPFLHSIGSRNIFLGESAGNLTLTGHQNTVIGVQALTSNTLGALNTAIGDQALASNTSGSGNTATGLGALAQNRTGVNNTASGQSAMVANTEGFNNTAMGSQALQGNTTGNLNVAVGAGAGVLASTGSNNIYLGALVLGVAGESNTMYLGAVGTQTKTVIAGVRGTAVVGGEPVVIDADGRLGSGAVAPGANTIGTSEVINDSLMASDLAPNSVTASELAPNSVTASELALDSVGASQVAFNYAASTIEGGPATDVACVDCVAASDLAADSVGTSEVAFNYAASTSEGGPATNLVCAACVGPTDVSFAFAGLGANTFAGTQTINGGSLDLDLATGNITKDGATFLHTPGTGNTFLGLGAGALNAGGLLNTAIGANALALNLTGDQNTAVGQRALEASTGSNNTAIGHTALAGNTTGGDNTAVGNDALDSNTSGVSNTAVGNDALQSATTSGGNTAVGTGALDTITSGSSSNTALGLNAGSTLTSGVNNLYLDSTGLAVESNTIRIGDNQTETFIKGIRGVTTGNLNAIPVLIDSSGQLGTLSSSRRVKEDIHDMADSSDRLFKLRPVRFRYLKEYRDGSKPVQFGLIAEEVAEVFPELAVRGADGEIETVHYETLNVLLLNEVQKQQRRLEDQQQGLQVARGTIERQESQLLSQQERIDALEQQVKRLLDVIAIP